MNYEYLWNKAGGDPEIEKLERTLAVFRYREAEAPATVPQYEASTEHPRRFRISFAFAFASLAIVAIISVVSLRTSPDNSQSENADQIVFVQSADVPEIGPVVEPKMPPRLSPESKRGPAGSQRRSVTPTSAAVRHRPKTKDSAPKDSIAALTKEERFAYRQLMLALSITSSKLKIVQDAIDGTQAVEDNSKNQR